MKQSNNLKLSICHLYPDSMNIYGDKGNIITLVKRCQWHNINPNVTEIKIGQKLDIDKFDLFFAGGGQDRSQLLVASDLQKKKVQIQKAVEKNKVFLLICGSYQLFGHYFKTHDNKKILGISVFDAYTIAGKKRKIANVIINHNFDFKPKTLVGFENHSGNTYLTPNSKTKPIGNIRTGYGNNDSRKYEGAKYKNCFGTYLHGSLLPKNPHFADYLISKALENKYGEKPNLKPLNDDRLEQTAHNFILKHRK